MTTAAASSWTQNTATNATDLPYMSSIRRSEGNVLVVFASLTIGLILIGTCVFVWLCRSRRIPPRRYGHVRRFATPSLYTFGDCTSSHESGRGSSPYTLFPLPVSDPRLLKEGRAQTP
ncbi:hypothetical protein LSCM1_03331 [Leishmania martiniquensis]|uniref:Uncharacterized protein n=1 Tax=Leishmania martiniquensis TaxID=1580590 RepID=A0A836KFQ8_9TRYP|nr:hypothetical protein LSCM1_03331 [Leishmania martiniquensis]